MCNKDELRSRERELLQCTESLETCDTGSEASSVREMPVNVDPDDVESVRSDHSPGSSPRNEVVNVENFYQTK